MKKIKFLILNLLLIISLIGCAGVSDYLIDLSDKYVLFHAGTSYICKPIGTERSGLHEKVIDENVVGLAWDDDYICVKQEIEETVNYWIIDIKTDEIYGELNYDEYNEKLTDLNVTQKIQLKSPKSYRHLEDTGY